MLDTNTKKRIDDCRDILVGKLPDPKAQIEQITIGLIYKFMDDMDRESIELGGTAKFFSGDYEKYAWDKLFDTKVTAVEMLTLYSEAIISMDKNPNIPQLFRDIFKNAYLPYRDPETLKLFLKTIGEFEYTHSEKLGDAFEYLLSVMGSQGDAGQFRTPRHIIDFLVAIVDPDLNDTILDPACGTAGFLISAFKHIKAKNNDQLTPDQRKKLIQNFVGYDISPDMVRLSLVNLYLHGFSEPHIYEYDTLSSEERWEENFDVILANPPFMSPKGGIRPHKRFTVQSKRSEVLFVDYIAEHLNPKGKAGIIIPEGVIFQSGKAYKELRKILTNDYLYAVVSLPAGVFNPYSGVKTSILLLEKNISKKAKKVLFVKIENDGYGLGAQRSAVKGGQLEEAIDTINLFKKSIIENKDFENTELAHAVEKTVIAKNGDFNFSGERYFNQIVLESNFDIVPLKDVFFKVRDSVVPLQLEAESVNYVGLENISQGTGQLVGDYQKSPKTIKSTKTIFKEKDVLYGKLRPNLNKVLFSEINGICSTDIFVLRANANVSSKFYSYYFRTQRFNQEVLKGIKGAQLPRVGFEYFSSIQIPLPPLSIQEAIVTEIEGYQKIIDGAKMVVDNYKPKIDIDPEWEMVELGKIANVISGFAFKSSDFLEDNPIRCIKITNVGVREFVDDASSCLPENYLNEYKKYAVNKGDLVISLTRTIISSGLKVTIVPEEWNETLVNQRVAGIKPTEKSNINFIYYYLCSDIVYKYVENKSRSLMQPNLSITDLKKMSIPFPSKVIQDELVSNIQKEQALVNANKELIKIFEQKIKDRIAKVWGE